MPIGEKINPKLAIKVAALYLSILSLKPKIAPVPADKVTASNPIGPACAIFKCKINTSSGTARIAPPAPVRDRIKPTKHPRLVGVNQVGN